MLTLLLSVSTVIAVETAILPSYLFAMDSDLHEYEISCKLMAIGSKEAAVCLKDWRFRFESESLNIKSAWLPRESLKLVLGGNETGAPVLWIEFSARRVGGLG